MPNVFNDPIVLRRVQLGFYCAGAVAALIMALNSIPDARLPWLICALLMVGSFVDLLRDKTTNR